MENYTHLILKQLQNKQGGLLMGGAKVSHPKIELAANPLKRKKKKGGDVSIKTGSKHIYIPHEFDTGVGIKKGGLSIKDIVKGAKEALGYAKQVCSLIHGSGILTGGVESGGMKPSCFVKGDGCLGGELTGGVKGDKGAQWQQFLKDYSKEHPKPKDMGIGDFSQLAGREFRAQNPPKAKKKLSSWNHFLGSYLLKHKNLEFSEAVKKASAKYKKQGGELTGGVGSGGELTGGVKGDGGAQWKQFLKDYAKANPKPKDMGIGDFAQLAGREFRAQNPPKAKKKMSSWNHFLGSYLLKHKDLDFSEAVKKASAEYKKKGGELTGGVGSGGVESGGELSGGVPSGGELTGGRKSSPWNAFLSAYRKKHPELKFGEVAKQASVEYKKMKG